MCIKYCVLWEDDTILQSPSCGSLMDVIQTQPIPHRSPEHQDLTGMKITFSNNQDPRILHCFLMSTQADARMRTYMRGNSMGQLNRYMWKHMLGYVTHQKLKSPEVFEWDYAPILFPSDAIKVPRSPQNSYKHRKVIHNTEALFWFVF